MNITIRNRNYVILLVVFTIVIATLIATSTNAPKTNNTPEPVLTITQPATQVSEPSLTPSVEIRIAWFYKPVRDDDLPQLANRYKFFILTRNDEAERDELLSLGIPKPVLQYFRVDAIEDPGTCTEQPFRNQVAYQVGDFCRISEEHPDWFLLDRSGSRISREESGKQYYHMDPGSRGWREFFIKRLKENMADEHWDGVFLDNLEVSLIRLESRGQSPIRYSNDQEYNSAIEGFLQYLRTGYFDENNRLIFANLIAARKERDRLQYIDLLDGTMHEGWAVSKAKGYYSVKTWESQMELAEQTQQAGSFIILVSQGDKEDLQKEYFTFASYLLINQGRAIFRYANSDYYNEIWWYENYAIDIGQPLGVRYHDGKRWYRDFVNGRVMVDPVTQEAEILLMK